MKFLIPIFLIFSSSLTFAQGSFAPNADSSGTTAIHKDSSVFIAWATSCIVQRGMQDIAIINSPLTTFGTDINATDKSGVNGTVSLGDGGIAILTFANPISNGTGNDFAVFENSFSNTFLELAVVEVSSDGVNYHRFPATSETQDTIQVGSFGDLDATFLHNLAGKYKAQYGTPFDLEQLNGTAGLDLNNITHIKIIDVVGAIDDNYATLDQYGNKINDPYPTAFGSGGFDLDAVGVINEQPIGIDENNASFKIYPNPAHSFIVIESETNDDLLIFDQLGSIVLSQKLINKSTNINCNHLSRGVYFVNLNGSVSKLILN